MNYELWNMKGVDESIEIVQLVSSAPLIRRFVGTKYKVGVVWILKDADFG